jgi:PAS domain S-box-containing protein
MILALSTPFSLKTRLTITTLLIFITSLWSFSYYISQMLHQDMERLLGSQQLMTVTYAAHKLNQELVARIDALHMVAEAVTGARMHDVMLMQDFLEGLPLLLRLFNGGVTVYQANGNSVATSSMREDAQLIDGRTLSMALHGRPGIGRPVMDSGTREAAFGMAVPIRDAGGEVIGALVGVVKLDGADFLEMAATARYGQTGGFMLVAPQERLVIAATDPRRVMTTLPFGNALVEGFVQGYEGWRVGVNPFGQEVLASAKRIPVANWYLAAALPTEEAFAPISAMQQRMLATTVLLTLLAGVLTWWVLQRLLEPMRTAVGTLARLSESQDVPQPLKITRKDEIGQLLAAFNGLLATLTQREEALRVAAIAFECQEGMIVTDANMVILRTNQSFTRIMGYSNDEVVGKSTAFMSSDRDPAGFDEFACEARRGDSTWHGEVWHKRKNGEVFPQWLTCTAVRNEHGEITHFVVTHTDITLLKQEEVRRLEQEAAQRGALVSEVQHRIKNNLQGIIGLLRQFAKKHPETAEPMNRAISQVQGISVIFGLQGRTVLSAVRASELTVAIAGEIQNIWQVPVALDIPPLLPVREIAESEAVPIALVITELIVNAVKHDDSEGSVCVRLKVDAQPNDKLRIHIINSGYLAENYMETLKPDGGLQLISALMPRRGARIDRRQCGRSVVTVLELEPPVVFQGRSEHT